MNYTNFVLFMLGMLGILMHNFMKMDSINKQYEGGFKLIKYIAIERFSILLSICVVVCAIIVKSEVKKLDMVGEYIGIGFIAIGYMAQSILTKYMGKVDNHIDQKTKYKAPNDEEQQNGNG